MVKYVDATVLAVLNDELLPCYFSRQSTHSFIFKSRKSVIFWVNLKKEGEKVK